ncbi:MAG: DprA-like winged helix domain-containing protein, partial [Kaistella sp.]
LGFLKEKEQTGELFPSSEITIQLTEFQQTVLKVLDKNTPLSLDEISVKLQIPSYKILPDLLQLEFLGCIKALSGRQYLAI